MDWWNLDQNGGNWWDRQTADATPAPSQGFLGSLVNGVENAGKGVGHFFGGMVKDIVDTTKEAGKSLFEATQADATNKASDEAQKQLDKIQASIEAQYKAGKLTKDQYAEAMQRISAGYSNISKAVSSEAFNKEDPVKAGAAVAETALNLATLGTGSAATQGTKEAIKMGGKEALQKIGTQAAEGGLLGSAYGITGDLKQNGSNAQPSDLWQNALFGAGGGALLGGGASFLDRGVRQGVKQLPGELSDNLIKPVYAHYDENAPIVGGLRPANELQTQLEDAWNHNDLTTAQKIIDQLPPDLKISMQSLQDSRTNPAQATHAVVDPITHKITMASNVTEPSTSMTLDHPYLRSDQGDFAQSVASDYSSPEQFINDQAKAALEQEKTRTGGYVIPGNDGGTVRATDHAPWYSQFYADNKRKPSLQAVKDIITQSYESGKPVNGLTQPDEIWAYQMIKDRNAGLDKTIAEGPPQEMSAQFMDSLAGKSDAINAPEQKNLKLGRAKGSFQQPPELPTPTPPEQSFPANQRGFFRNIQTSETANPELKKAVSDINPQTYSDITTNRELVNKAILDADNNPQAIHDKILSGNELNDQDVVSGMHLMNIYQQTGKADEAARLADALDTNLRAHGRAVQAASVWGRLTPEGFLKLAANRTAKAREDISAGRGYGKGVGAEKQVAKGIQDTVEGTGTIDRKMVTKAIQGAAKGSAKEQKTTGEKIAASVEKMATPEQKQKADDLVKEITKKIKQEMLEPPTKGPARSPIDVMREVFSRNKEAQDAFPEAQRILMDKAKDNPEMQKTLQKFFESELGNPVSASTINAAIKEQMLKNQEKISSIIERSWNGQTASIDKIATDLTAEGFDEQSAKAIAKEVTDRLKAQVVEAKQRALQRLAKDAPKRQRATFLDKVTKLSNLGALDNQDYVELARAKLKLPQLTSDTAQKVSELAQKMQEMEPGYERDKIAHQIYRTINESIPKTWGQKATELVSAPKAIMASYDISGVLRQGGVLGSRFRAEAASAFKKQVTYFKSADAYEKGMSAIRHDPMYETAARAKIALTGVEGGEEAFVSQLPEKIPLFGKGVQASDRAYTGALTELRFGAFKHIAKDLADEGIDISAFSDEQLQSIGKFINTASGRGYGKTGGTFEKVAPALNRTLFSPRLWKSRLDMLNPAYYYKLDPVARKYALQSAGSFAAIAATVLGLAAAAGAKVETDPRSSDFLKIRVGDTRYDILGGFQQNIVFAARELSGEKKSSTTGEMQSLTSGKYGSANRLSILTDLIQNKENPVISTGSTILAGTDKTGQPVNVKNELASLLIPLNVQDTYSLAKSTDPLQALLGSALPGSIGVGVNTYQSPNSDPYAKFAAALAPKQ